VDSTTAAKEYPLNCSKIGSEMPPFPRPTGRYLVVVLALLGLAGTVWLTMKVRESARTLDAERFRRLTHERWSALELVLEKHDTALVILQDFAKARLGDDPEDFAQRWSNRVERLVAPQNLKGLLEVGYAVAVGDQGPAPMTVDGRVRPGTSLPPGLQVVVTQHARFGPLPSLVGSNLFCGTQVAAIMRAHQEYRPRITQPFGIEAVTDGIGILQLATLPDGKSAYEFRSFTSAPTLIGLRMYVAVGHDRPKNVIPPPPRRLAGVVFATVSLDHIESSIIGAGPGEVELEVTVASAGPADDITEAASFAGPVAIVQVGQLPEPRCNGGGVWARGDLPVRRVAPPMRGGWTTNFVVPSYSQRWRVRAYATKNFAAHSHDHQAVWVGAGGAVLTALLTGLVGAQARGWQRTREALWHAQRAERLAQVAAELEAAKKYHLHEQVLNPLRAILFSVNQRIHAVTRLKNLKVAVGQGLDDLESQLESDREYLEDFSAELRRDLAASATENPYFGSEVVLRRSLIRDGSAGGAAIRFEADDGFFEALDAQQADYVHGVAREAVTNAWRHGSAKNIVVLCRLRGKSAFLEIRDDGVGFEPKEIVPKGVGLASFRERARRLGGHATVSSIPGESTTVQFEFPLRAVD
jgi:signal transduction histidine kinase